MACSHCGSSAESNPCKRCAQLIPKLTTAFDVLRPKPEMVERVLAALKTCVSNDISARLRAAIDAAPDHDILPALECEYGGPYDVSEELLEIWGEVDINNPEFSMHDTHLPTPDGKMLEVFGNTEIDGITLSGILPFYDLADSILELEEDGIRFKNWSEMVKVISSASWHLNGDLSLGVVQSRIFDAVPHLVPEQYRDTELGMYYHTAWCMHPFWRVANLTKKIDYSEQLSHNENLSPRKWNKLCKRFGRITHEWREQFSECHEKIREVRYIPPLIVRYGRIHMLCRDEMGFTSVHVPPDADLWGHLFTAAMHPPDSEMGQWLRAVQWVILTGESTDLVTTGPELRALKLLSKVWSMSPSFDYAEDGSLVVEGSSKLAYRLFFGQPNTDWDISVRSYRNKELAISGTEPIPVCIQLGNLRLPLGDRVVSYLLALKEDEASSEDISTLNELLETWFDGRAQTEETWQKMGELHPNGFVEHEEEDWDDDDYYNDYDDDWEDDDDDEVFIVVQGDREIEDDNNSTEQETSLEVSDETWDLIANLLGEN